MGKVTTRGALLSDWRWMAGCPRENTALSNTPVGAPLYQKSTWFAQS